MSYEREAPELTPRQAQTMAALERFQRSHQRPPTRAELGQELGVRPQTADYHLRALARLGLIDLSRHARGVQVRAESGLPVLGRVAAGSPQLAIEHAEQWLPAALHDKADYALQVQGDSMVDAGVLEGDFVLVRVESRPSPGEMVVAWVGEGEWCEATVKYYRPGRTQTEVELHPANPAYSVQRYGAHDHLQFGGVVVGLYREMDQ